MAISGGSGHPAFGIGRGRSRPSLVEGEVDRYGRREARMQISARNQLKGTIKHVTPGAVMSEVVVDVGGQQIVAMSSLQSVQRLGLQPGDAVVAIVKSTDVMIGK